MTPPHQGLGWDSCPGPRGLRASGPLCLFAALTVFTCEERSEG